MFVKMKSWKTKNGFIIYKVLTGRSNSYLISSEKNNILIDTGKKSAYNRLNRNIDLLKLTNQKIAFLILTHTHFDHCQTARKFKEKNNCQIIVSEKALESIKNGYTILPNGTTLISKLMSKIGKIIGKRKFGYQSFQPDIIIEGNHDLNKLGVNFKIIETIGHSIDSISIIIDNEIAVVGDTMFGIFKNSVFPPYADNVEEMIKSWGKLLNSDCHTFLPGHGKEVKRELLQQEYDKYSLKYGI